MKNVIVILLLSLASTVAFAQGFTVNSFTADIYLREAGYFDVVERYDVDFTEAKHGIFREIVTTVAFRDENGQVSDHEIYVSDIDVPKHPFKTNEVFGKLLNNKLHIRIGDKNTLVTGRQHYEIRYRVKNALIFTDDEVQLYWNIKPSEWLTVFNAINFTIHTPDRALLSPENCFVYAGNAGDTVPSTEFTYDYSGTTFSSQSKEGFFSLPGQSVTVLVKLPESLVRQVDFTPPFAERYRWLMIGGVAFLALLLSIKLRLRAIRVTPVTSYYPPESIDPAMAGVLIDNKTDFRDVSCLLPYWATQGIIRIAGIGPGENTYSGDLNLIKLKDLPAGAAGYEHLLFNKIFAGKDEVRAGSLRGIYAEPHRLLAKASEVYYTRKNTSLKLIVATLSWLWAFFGITFLPFLVKPYIDIESGKFIGFVIFNFIFFFIFFPVGFAYLVNKLRGKSKKGLAVMPALLGFHQFIKMAEMDRIKTLLEDDPYYFEKTMPYAVAFNLLKAWTAKFEGLLRQAPEWYSGASETRFNMNRFASSFGNNLAAASAAMVTAPSSSRSSGSSSRSGGGSSGGGFGGGGGGSW